MDTEATFSQSVALTRFDLVKGIEEIQIKDFNIEPEKEDPAPKEGEHKDVEFIHFEL